LEVPENLEPTSAWRDIRAELRRVLGDSTYEIWISPLELKALDGRQLLLIAPPAMDSWVAARYGRVLEACAQTVLGDAIRVAIATADKPSPAAKSSASTSEQPISTLNPRYSFEQFVIGDANRLAHAACLAVAEFPGQAYNPLFLHAPPGLGKTHLLHAIGNYLAMAGAGGGTVRYTTVESFTNHFVGALGSRSLHQFKHTYRDVDVLLIDDVQFLASKAKTEEEFFHTFNALYEQGRQLVLTCDRLPHALLGVEERLRERFEAGLVADMKPPDFGTRVAILRKRAMVDQVQLADQACLELIAERIVDNVRALEGALIRVVAYHSLTGQPIDLSLTTKVLDTLYPQHMPKAPPASSRIQHAVASFYDVSIPELVSPNRAIRVAWPRQVAMYLIRELTADPLQTIGQAFGGRNHATILHACKRVAERAHVDHQIRADLDQLKRNVLSAKDDRVC
jgi:chromosomal replication initiator protein